MGYTVELNKFIDAGSGKEEIEQRIKDVETKMKAIETTLDKNKDEFSESVNKVIKKELDNLISKKLELQHELAESKDSISIAYNLILALNKLRQINSISEINIRDYFSRMIPVNKNRIIFVVGKKEIPDNIDLNCKLKYQGTYTYKVRKTNILVNFGIYLNF